MKASLIGYTVTCVPPGHMHGRSRSVPARRLQWPGAAAVNNHPVMFCKRSARMFRAWKSARIRPIRSRSGWSCSTQASSDGIESQELAKSWSASIDMRSASHNRFRHGAGIAWTP